MLTSLEQKIKRLPPQLYQEVDDFVSLLIKKNKIKPKKKLKLNWAGGLKEFKKQFDSVSLQKKALDWWHD